MQFTSYAAYAILYDILIFKQKFINTRYKSNSSQLVMMCQLPAAIIITILVVVVVVVVGSSSSSRVSVPSSSSKNIKRLGRKYKNK